MNARGVLAFMACLVLVGGVAQGAASPMNYFESFNYETQQDFDAAWPMVMTSSASVTAVPMTLRFGDGGPQDPLEATLPEWNNSIGGTPAATGNKRNYDVLPSTFNDLNTYRARENGWLGGPARDLVVDFWYYDTHSTGYARHFIEFRNYKATSAAAAGFPLTIGGAATAPTGGTAGYDWILAFGPYASSGVSTNYWFRNLGYGTNAWRNSGLVRSVGWHHFKITIQATSVSTGQVNFWDITNPAAPVLAPTNQTLSGTNAAGKTGLSMNVVMFGGGTSTSGQPTGFDGWLDDLRITPEPVSVALLGLGSLLLRRRRA